MAKGKDVTVEFERERETKNAVRFSESEENREKQQVGKLYVKKSADKTLGNPESISVTISPA